MSDKEIDTATKTPGVTEASLLLARSGVTLSNAVKRNLFSNTAATGYPTNPLGLQNPEDQLLEGERTRIRADLEKALNGVANAALRGAIQAKIDSLAGATSIAEIKVIQTAAMEAISNAEAWGSISQTLSMQELENEKKLQDMLNRTRSWLTEDAEMLNRAYECGVLNKKDKDILDQHREELDELLAKIQDASPGIERDALLKKLQIHAIEYALTNDKLLPDAIKKLKDLGLDDEAKNLEKMQARSHEIQKDINDHYTQVNREAKQQKGIENLASNTSKFRFADEETNVSKDTSNADATYSAIGNESLGELTANVPKKVNSGPASGRTK